MTRTLFMPPEAFVFWLDLVRFKKLASSDGEAGHLLGLTKNTVVTMKKQGADKRTALACEAVLKGLKPFQRTHAFLPNPDPDHYWDE